MAANRRPKQSPVGSGRRGPRGRTGPVGPPGASGNGEVKKLAAQMADVVQELQTQLTRIAQLQMQLDRLATGMPIEGERRKVLRKSH